MSKPLSKEFLLNRGYCCGNGCLNCPYIPKHQKHNDITGKYKTANNFIWKK